MIPLRWSIVATAEAGDFLWVFNTSVGLSEKILAFRAAPFLALTILVVG